MKTKTEKILRENVTTVLHAVLPALLPPWDPNTPRRFAAKFPEGAASPRTLVWGEGTYDGAELRPFTGRPGSMTAYSLPSKGTT